MNIEDDLRNMLKREPAPPNFATGVLAKATARDTKAEVPFWRRPAVFLLAAGLAVAAFVPPAVSEYRRHQQARGLEARRELLVALSVTRTKLLHVKEAIRRNTRNAL